MREIKFRTFYKDENILYRDVDISSECLPIDDENVVIMQYTGLKDKNGVDIYEGDIVMYDLGIDNEKPEKYKIIFDSKQCAYFLYPLEDKARLRHFTYSAKNDCEVIGNIYQNPELLESKC